MIICSNSGLRIGTNNISTRMTSVQAPGCERGRRAAAAAGAPRSNRRRAALRAARGDQRASLAGDAYLRGLSAGMCIGLSQAFMQLPELLMMVRSEIAGKQVGL